MTYQDWCKHSKTILAQADEYNKWRKETQYNLLTVVGPKIAKLGNTFYSGCGFHCGLEQDFGKLVSYLTIAWQPCANWCAKIEDDMANNMVNEIIYSSIVKKIDEIEKSLTPTSK